MPFSRAGVFCRNRTVRAYRVHGVKMATMTELWRMRFEWLKNLGFAALLGMLFLIAAFLANAGVIQTVFIVTGLLAIVPGFFYLFAVTIWHWKARYRGNHSDLWGALLLIETSGWFKLVYLFRHIIPDARHSGRYAIHESTTFPPPSTAADDLG